MVMPDEWKPWSHWTPASTSSLKKKALDLDIGVPTMISSAGSISAYLRKTFRRVAMLGKSDTRLNLIGYLDVGRSTYYSGSGIPAGEIIVCYA